MAVGITEEMTASLHKGLSEWWSEETEYVFQRIERWAAFARGYNRLRSQRLSRGRLTMQEEQEPRWSISSNKIIIEDPAWSPRFHNLKRSHRRRSRPDENCKINCCGTFNYQSNGNIDSTCLETYRYDHSIYFKTIGDIKSSKRGPDDSKSEIDRGSCCSDEQVEWEVKTAPDCLEDRYSAIADDRRSVGRSAGANANTRRRVPEIEVDLSSAEEPEEPEVGGDVRNSWPIVDLSTLSLDVATGNAEVDVRAEKIGGETNEADEDSRNNNCTEQSVDSTQKTIQLQIAQLSADRTWLGSSTNSRCADDNREGSSILGLRKQRRSPKRVLQPTVIGDNNVLWPGVLLNYTKNVDPESSPHHHHRRAVHVK